MANWEYKTVEFSTKGITGGLLDINTFNSILNDHGRNGWELVSCFGLNQAYWIQQNGHSCI